MVVGVIVVAIVTATTIVLVIRSNDWSYERVVLTYIAVLVGCLGIALLALRLER